MSQTPTILLTNDDGIDAPGLEALRTSLTECGTVRVVAPQTDMSGAGRSISLGRTMDPIGEADADVSEAGDSYSFQVPYTDHEHGFVIDGTPCECVICGLYALETAPDIVVSGCNPGPNTGQHTASRSGTVSAVMEAAILGTPGIAISMDTMGRRNLEVADYQRAGRFVEALIRVSTDENVFDDIDYLTVTLPAPDEPIRGVEVTRPSPDYRMDAIREDDTFRIRSMSQTPTDDTNDGTEVIDRNAVDQGKAIISPLRVPVRPTRTAAVESVASALSDRFADPQSSTDSD
ncbi:5'/3'-nucleotidase SurE [Salinadaptatus halalkaliphilus]|uniref:5'-nucleotidase SurE n=1 Tax=Salinadaptatus halalkaliphilus TaxID=2419781 RepID=A0A4S3TKM7_9EURY|nr:5'/3'-nucleotidase SurE [Salinadaptatus halalkaliphilus]THE64689.1 5'/3'-nucleotidase SurE [Salinadaptatus halalkaliphilus]